MCDNLQQFVGSERLRFMSLGAVDIEAIRLMPAPKVSELVSITTVAIRAERVVRE